MGIFIVTLLKSFEEEGSGEIDSLVTEVEKLNQIRVRLPKTPSWIYLGSGEYSQGAEMSSLDPAAMLMITSLRLDGVNRHAFKVLSLEGFQSKAAGRMINSAPDGSIFLLRAEVAQRLMPNSEVLPGSIWQVRRQKKKREKGSSSGTNPALAKT